MATTASLPAVDSTDSLTPPDRMYITTSQDVALGEDGLVTPVLHDSLGDSDRIEKRLGAESGGRWRLPAFGSTTFSFTAFVFVAFGFIAFAFTATNRDHDPLAHDEQ
jgi:hypothetical protein